MNNGGFGHLNTAKYNMDIFGQTLYFNDDNTVLGKRFDLCGQGKGAQGRNFVKVKLINKKNTGSKSQASEDELLTFELPGKRLLRSAKVNLPSVKDMERNEKKGKSKAKSVKKALKKSSPKKTKAQKKRGVKDNFEKDYEVEKILKVKILKNGKKEFLIHWKGFSAEFDTWEPESNLDCKDLVNEYFEEQKEVIYQPTEEVKKGHKRKSQLDESPRSSRSKRANFTMDLEKNAGDTKKEGRAKRQSQGQGKKEASRETRSRSGSVRKREEAPKTDTGKGGKMIKTEKREGNETLKNPSNSSEVEEIGGAFWRTEEIPSGAAEAGDQGEFEVERILDVRYLKDGTRHFLIKWKGFAKKYNTWEPESNMNCSEKLEKFLKGLEESSTERQLRAERKKTSRFTVDDERRGRKLSVRLGKMPRKSYSEMDYNY